MLAFAVTRKRVVLAGTVALALGALGACKSDKILNVTTPDVLPPAAFSTPAGADPLRFGVVSDFVRAYDGNTDAFTVVSGNLADELYATDTFDGRLTINSRKSIELNNEMETEYRYIQQANVGASTAAVFLAASVPAQKWQRGEMYVIRGYTELFMAEAWCSGSAIATVAADGTVTPGTPNTTAQLFTRAAADFDSALVLADTSQRVKYGSQIGKGRALLNLAKYTEAAAAVAGVPRTFQYLTFHSTSSGREENGMWNAEANGSTRYSIISKEGTNGLPYLATTTDPRIPWAPSTRIGFNAISTNIPTELKFGRTTSGILADGTEGQLIALEARLQGNTQADRDFVFAGLNALRASNSPAIPAIAGTAPTTQAAAVDQLFAERAYWMWLTGHRLGDMRRLVRVYGRDAETVFPIGNQPTPLNGTYGTGVTITIPKNERNNTNFQGCIDNKA
jgi:hypothetical protein